jgi:large conductance mechanosensitive channel
MSFSKEFKEFAIKGNVVDLAVAVVIGAAFNEIVKAIVDGLLMPVVGVVTPSGQWESWTIDAGKLHLRIGLVLAATIKFLAIALTLFVIVKKVINAKKDEPPPAK